MDHESQVFSHQLEVVNFLAANFENVTVLTAYSGKFKVAENVEVHCSNWKEGHRTRSLLKFYWKFFRIISTRKITSIFSHMTSVQSAFTSPITRILGIKHYLWYAHTSKNMYFRISKLFINGIITSTAGSCPATGKKIFPIGQAIDGTKFVKKSKSDFPLSKYVHIGRLDPSKNLEMIIQVAANLKNQNPNITLEIIGSASSNKHKNYAKKLVTSFSSKNYSNWIKFTPKIKRDLIPQILREKDCFIHAFQGSLDKSIVEATFVGLPVITINKEYLDVFGTWSGNELNKIKDLQNEADSLLNITKSNLEIEIDKRFRIAREQHELRNWIVSLVKILKFGRVDINH